MTEISDEQLDRWENSAGSYPDKADWSGANVLDLISTIRTMRAEKKRALEDVDHLKDRCRQFADEAEVLRQGIDDICDAYEAQLEAERAKRANAGCPRCDNMRGAKRCPDCVLEAGNV